VHFTFYFYSATTVPSTSLIASQNGKIKVYYIQDAAVSKGLYI